MKPKKTSSLRIILKAVISLFALTLLLVVTLFLSLPPLLSSDFARKKAVVFLSQDLKRPVSINKLSFSWKKGLAVSGLNIKNQDHSPFLALRDFNLNISWRALLAKKIFIQNLNIDGIEVAITRDKTGKTNLSDLLKPPKREPTPKKRRAKFTLKALPKFSLDAHLKDGQFTFIDQRLSVITRVKNLTADLSVKSLFEPITAILKGEIAINEKAPEPLELTGSFLISPERKLDFQNAQGKLELKANFGHLEAFIDFAKFNTTKEETGASLSCFFDLYKLSQIGAGILGFPPGFTLKGQLKTWIEASGNFHSRIAIKGETRLSELLMTGGPFKDVPFSQREVNFSQDILLNFPENSMEIKSIKLNSHIFNFFISGAIRDLQKKPNGKLLFSGNGNLHELVRILKKTHALPPDIKISGTMNLSLTGTGDLKTVTIKGKTKFEDLNLTASFLGSYPYQEKRLEIIPDILITIPKNLIDLTSLSIRSETINANIKGALDSEDNIDLKVKISTKFPKIKKQLQGILPPTFPNQGQLSSDFSLQGNLKKLVSIKGNHTIKDLRVTLPLFASNKKPSSSPFILSHPKKIILFHDLDFNSGQDTITMNKVQVNSEFLNFDGSGVLSGISTNPSMKSQGRLVLNLPKLQEFLGDLLPEKLSFKGKGEIVFSGEGQLKPPKDASILSTWNGEGSLSLDSIEYSGFGSIQNLHTTKLSLNKGILQFILKYLLNNGPSQLEGKLDFRRIKPETKIKMEIKDAQVSQNLKILGYIIPVLITSSSGKLTGKGNFSIQASWQGIDWDKEISRTITGKGILSLNEGMLRSEDVLSVILKSFGKPETLQFDQILTGFRIGDGKIYSDDIQVNGKDLKFSLQGWTSLIYDPSQKGNPMEYTVRGDFLKQSLGKDGKKVLSLLGGEELFIPVVIGGTVQKPRVSIKMPRLKDFFRGIFSLPK